MTIHRAEQCVSRLCGDREKLKNVGFLTPAEVTLMKDFIKIVSLIEGAVAVYVYGSRAEMLSDEHSDIDVAVVVAGGKKVERKARKTIEEWINAIDNISISHHPVVVGLQRLKKTAFGKNIKGGVLIYGH